MMDKKLLQELVELRDHQPRPKWGKLLATLRVNNVKEIGGHKWRGKSADYVMLLLEIEELQHKVSKPKKKVAKKAAPKEE
jgi:hypothetical protein